MVCKILIKNWFCLYTEDYPGIPEPSPVSYQGDCIDYLYHQRLHEAREGPPVVLDECLEGYLDPKERMGILWYLYLAQ